MKKLLIALLVLTTVLNSCSKQEDLIKTSTESIKSFPLEGFTGVSLSDKGYVVFDNEENYNTFLEVMKDLSTSEWDKWELSLGFTSLRTSRQQNVQNKTTSITDYNTEVEDELLLTFIDQYGVVQIGNMIFKAEIDKDLVWTLDAQHLDKYGALLGRQFDASTMNIFRISLDENRTGEVWDVVLSGIVGIDESNGSYKTTGIFGEDHHPPCDEYIDKTYEWNPDTQSFEETSCTTYRADFKSSYQNALFYKSLMTELKYMKRDCNSSGFWSQVHTNIWAGGGSYCNYKTKKRRSTTQYPTHPGQTWDNKYNWRPYSGSRRLESYHLETNYYITNQANQQQRGPLNTGIHK